MTCLNKVIGKIYLACISYNTMYTKLFLFLICECFILQIMEILIYFVYTITN